VKFGIIKLILVSGALLGAPALAFAQATPETAQTRSDKQAKQKSTLGANAQGKAETPSGLDPVTRRVRQMADELRSPFCPGKTLMTCTSYQAFELRREIETMVRDGMTDAEILKRLKTVHGNDISNPQQPWYTFFVPFLPFIVLAGLIFWIVRRWKTRGQETAIGGADMEESPELLEEQIDEDRRARLRARVMNNQD